MNESMQMTQEPAIFHSARADFSERDLCKWMEMKKKEEKKIAISICVTNQLIIHLIFKVDYNETSPGLRKKTCFFAQKSLWLTLVSLSVSCFIVDPNWNSANQSCWQIFGPSWSLWHLSRYPYTTLSFSCRCIFYRPSSSSCKNGQPHWPRSRKVAKIWNVEILFPSVS